APLVSDADEVTSAEIRVTSGWEKWSDIASSVPTVAPSAARLKVEEFIGSTKSVTVTGRVEVESEPGPYNVLVSAIIEGQGDQFVYVSAFVDCLNTGERASFDASDLTPVPKKPKLVLGQ